VRYSFKEQVMDRREKQGGSPLAWRRRIEELKQDIVVGDARGQLLVQRRKHAALSVGEVQTPGASFHVASWPAIKPLEPWPARTDLTCCVLRLADRQSSPGAVDAP
jgi:hypothetical protein